MRRTTLFILPCLLLIVCGLAACASGTPTPAASTATPQAPVVQASPTPQAAPGGDDWSVVKAAGVLRVASPLDNPPFNMYNGNFQPDGFDVALLTEAARRLGLSVQFDDYAFEGLLGALQLNQVDAVIAAMAVTPDRLAKVDFTQSYYTGEDAILAAANSPITPVSDLAAIATRRVGVQSGTVYESWLEKNLVQTGKMPQANLQLYSQPGDAVRDLGQGRIDLVIVDQVPGLQYEAQGQAKVVGKSTYVQNYAVAVRKGSTLLPQLNRALAELAHDGTVARLSEQYLHIPAADVTPVAPTPQPAEPTAVPSPQPTPTLAPIDGMTYVADLTLDDHNMTSPPVAQPGQALQKGWRLKNSGTTTWTPDYHMDYANGNTAVSRMGGQVVLIGHPVAPGETTDVYINLVAPQAPGVYQGFWQIMNTAGVPFGNKVYVAVQVPARATPIPPPTATPAPNMSFTVDRDHINSGECVNFSWNVNNVKAVYFCVGSGNCSAMSGQSSRKDCPGGTTTYNLRVDQNNGQTVMLPITVYVAPPANAPVISTFSSDRSSIRQGECVKLWWQVDGTTSRVALLRNGQPLWDYAAAQHDYQDCPQASGHMTYELQAWGAGGSGPVKRQLGVDVQTAPPQPQTLSLDESACGSVFDMRSGDVLIVTLRGPGGSGYSWDQIGGNPSVLTPTGPVNIQPGNGPGAAASYIWTYRAAPGKTTASWVWHRPSEGDTPPAKQCDLTATVH